MLTKYKNVFNNIMIISLMITVCLIRITITKSMYWILALVLTYYSFAYKTCLNKFDEIMTRIEPNKRLKTVKILICIFTALSVVLKTAILLNYWLTIDQFNDGILFKSEFLQLEIFGEKLISKPAASEYFIKKRFFIMEVILENIIFIFTVINICSKSSVEEQPIQEAEENRIGNKRASNFNVIPNNNNHTKDLSDDNETFKVRKNSSAPNIGNTYNLSKNVLTGALIKKELKSYLDEKFMLYALQFLFLAVLTLLNVSLLNIPVFLTLILMMTFSIFFPNSFNPLDRINKAYGMFSFLLLLTNYIKNSHLLKNTKEDYLIGILNFEVIYSYTYLGLLFLSFINCSCIQYYDISDEKFSSTEEDIEKRIIDEIEEEKQRLETFMNQIEPNKDEKYQNNYLETLQTDDEESNIFNALKNFFFLISPLLYKVILLMWILFHVCLIMFINFVILFFAIEKAKKYFKLYYLIPSFLVCILFTALQFTFNMNGLFYYENIKTYKILEIVGIYKIYKTEVTDFSNTKFIDLSNEAKLSGMLFNIIAMSLVYCFGLALSVSSEDQQISASRKQTYKSKDEEINKANDANIKNNPYSKLEGENDEKNIREKEKDEKLNEKTIHVLDDDTDKNQKEMLVNTIIQINYPNQDIINTNQKTEIGNDSNFKNDEGALERISKKMKNEEMENNFKNNIINNNQMKEKNFLARLKLQLKHFWIEKSYLSCIVITFICSVIKFDLLHVIYFVYFIVLLCLGDKGFKPVWDNLMLINRIIIIIILYFWNILAVNFLDLEKETNPEIENIFTYLGLKISKNAIFFVEYWEHILLYLFGYLHNYFVVYWYIYIVNNDNKNNINISIDNSLNSSYLENEKIASVKHIYRFPEWTRKMTICLVILLMVELAFIRPLSFQGLFFFVLSLIFIATNLFIMSENKKYIIRGFIKTLIIISIISIVLKYCINFSFMVNYLKELFNLEDFVPLEDKANTINGQNTKRLLSGSLSMTEEESLNSYTLVIYNTNNNDFDNPNLKNFSLQDFGLDVKNFKLKLFINFLMILAMKILYSYSYYHEDQSSESEINRRKNSSKNKEIELFDQKFDDENGPSIFDYIAIKIKNSKNTLIQKTQEIVTYVIVFFNQLIYLHACKTMFLVAVFVCVSVESMIGVILFGVILISLFMERHSGWRYSFFPLVLISIMVMSFIYICKMNAFKKWMTKDYEWFGLYNPKSSSILAEEFPYIFILFTCYLSRISAFYKHYFTTDVVEESEKNEKDKVFENYFKNNSNDTTDKNNKEELINSCISAKNEITDTKKEDNSKKSEEKKEDYLNHNSDDKTIKAHFDKENEGQRLSSMKMIAEMEKQNEEIKEMIENLGTEQGKQKTKNKQNENLKNESIIKMTLEDENKTNFSETEIKAIALFSQFWIKLDFFWYLYGFYVVLITIMLIAFIKVNLLSLCLMIFVGYQSFGKYIRTEYITEKEENNKENLKFLKKYWFLFAVFLSIFSFMQYINYMWFPPSWKIAKPWEHSSFFCSRDGKSIYSNNVNFKNNSDFDYCVTDWKAWLNIDNYSTKDIFYNFICLFILLISNKYLTHEELPYRKRVKFSPENSNNFTIAENRKTFWDTLIFISFVYLKSLILFCIIIMSIVYTYKYTNVIYSGFMFISFYMLFKDSYLIKKKNELWKIVQFYNFFVLVFFMLFQTPFFPCPINRDGRSYVGLDECVEEENKLYKSFLLFEYPKFWADALYMVAVQTIGLLKLDFKLLVVGNLSLFLIYIVALIQQIIFDHPYQYFVDRYLEIEKNINCKSRAFKIVQDSHLKLKCDYRKIHTNMEILNDKLQRLNRKTTEYANLWDQKLNSYNEKQNGYLNEKKNNENNSKENSSDNYIRKVKLLEEIDILIENTLNENDLAGEVDYYAVKRKVLEIRQKLEEELEKNVNKNGSIDNYLIKDVEDLNNKNNEEMNDENEKLMQDNGEANLIVNDHIKTKEISEEQKFKSDLIERLITELGNLITIQRKNDKLILYKSKDHGLDMAFPVFERMTKERELEDVYDEELGMLKILFPHPNKDQNSVSKSPKPERKSHIYALTENVFKNNEIKLSTDKIVSENKLKENLNEISLPKISKMNDFNLNKGDFETDDNKISFNNKEENKLVPDAHNQVALIEERKSKTEITKHPQFVYIKNKIHSKYYYSGISRLKMDKSKEEKSAFQYIYYKLRKAIDNILLIDLASSSFFKPNSIFEVLLYWIYSKIEIIIVIAFLINMCMDASVISMVYPISYFGYALLEYPFTNKYYWKFLTIYSLVTIVLKLFYQLPFICGYPFLAIFNPFSDNYCETYNLSETDFLDNFEYFLGFRKYNGEYSYPKNAGLLSGIFWDIIILFLLLCNRSLLKSKGIWNFIDIHKEFTKVPVFVNQKNVPNEHLIENNRNKNQEKHETEFTEKTDSCKEKEVLININKSEEDVNLLKKDSDSDRLMTFEKENKHLIQINKGENYNPNSVPNSAAMNNKNVNMNQNNRNLKKQITFEDRAKEYYDSLSNFVNVFFKRLAPELYLNDGIQISKPGVDYYPHTFACLLVILIYILFFFGSITGRNGQSFSDILDKQQFSIDLVWTTVVIALIIVLDRVIYKYRSVNTDFIFDRLNIQKNTSKDIQNKHGLFNEEIINKEDDENKANKNKNANQDKSAYINAVAIGNLNANSNKSESNLNSKKMNNSRRIDKDSENEENDNVLNQYFVKIADVDSSNRALMVKLILHYILLAFTHLFIFIRLPLITRIYVFQNSSLIFLYILCCIYFYLTSLQIKYGFPLITKGQYFASSTNLYNRLAFKIYRNVPFLYELRGILDWTITKTSLDLFQWFKLEDAYANLYETKCDMALRRSRKRGEERWWFEKFSWGFCFFIVLMLILILPMILFSSFNPNLVENKVLGGKFSVNLELRNPDLDTTTFTLNLFEVNSLKINKIKNPSQYKYLKNTLIPQVDDVEERKIQKTKIINYSQLDWILSPPTIRELLTNLEKKTDCYINIDWEFRREFPPNNRNIVGTKSNQLSRDQISMLRYIIFSLKTHQKPEKFKLDIKDAFPKIIRLSNKQFKYVKFDSKHKTQHKEFSDIQLQLIKENERDIYWKINQIDIKNITDSPFYNKNDELSFILINDDVISSFFGFNSDGGIPLSIVGIYATLVWTVGKFIRIFFDKISQRVIYEEMPEPNELFELCEGIYIYRNQRNLVEENKLYDLLIRILRSPETLIKLTNLDHNKQPNRVIKGENKNI